MFRSKILPAIIAFWGAAIVVNLLVSGPNGNGAYASGQYAAGAFGLVMVVAGVSALAKARAN